MLKEIKAEIHIKIIKKRSNKMKRFFLLLAIAGAVSMPSMAQDDDLYFMSNKEVKPIETGTSNHKPTYYRGTNRSVDEYNRAGRFRSYYQKIGTDSLGNDIITFQSGEGVGPDTSYVDTAYVYPGSIDFDDDFEYTRRMNRWDGYYDPWFYGYAPWRFGWYGGWYDPWYYGYGGWYDPWYYSWYGGWYDPWYYGYGGWYGPYYRGWYGYPFGWYGGGYVRYDGGNPRGLTGGRTWSYGNRRSSASTGSFGRGTAGGNRQSTNTYTSRSGRNRSFGGRTNSTRSARPSSRSNSTFGNSTRSTPNYNSGSFGSSRPSGGSFGGGRPSGGSFGGGRSVGGGGGHFGGGRR